MISVIIPVLNEAEGIGSCLDQFMLWANHLEIIVADGGSDDGTQEIVRKYPVKLRQCPLGRGQQMNHGAAIATGDILLFLHSDTFLPENFIETIEITLAKPGVVAGAFQLEIDDPQPNLRWIERTVRWRSQFFSLPYGDQGIFVKTDIFRTLGGYAALPIMEDYEFICRLKQQGHIAIAATAVKTSPRRWQKLGIWRTTFLNQAMIMGYHLGVKPDTLRQWYRQQAS
ncbi:TIGR04283 family arsenosugar biosynthesis glycosyltransferase [[Limnothrix rosea] IAM M-220]|uniref:TIGR04283 family arsenosugar biosynthesis glycosyltransferase n=1 Tax=[Limnothrix rosea] IAM M-220 TaxID=454133 RepID=UPI00096545FE|nr:TIGR04283 family arsenosugar biosynthesis glycosyltransferase [[Limnothrix rosea] IAM M-220]OKH19275.1 glycosyltransferase [[Limnothrix rosea] IAM M-220]